MTEGNFPGKECTKQLLLYLLTGDVKANFSREYYYIAELDYGAMQRKSKFYRESRYYYIVKLDYGAMQRFRHDKIA